MKLSNLSKGVWIILVSFFISTRVHGQDEANSPPEEEAGKEKVNVKYKEYEKFDFDELEVDAQHSKDGNLSITPREQIKFQNKLPLRKNFNHELKKSVEKVK